MNRQVFPISNQSNYTNPVNFDEHKRLHAYYLKLLANPAEFKLIPNLCDPFFIDLEKSWDNYELNRIKNYSLPSSASEFEKWYFSWVNRHKEATFELFDYLAKEATLTDMAVFFVAEEKVDSKFDDLMALAQLGTTNSVKLIIAQNYWDEMGDGNPELIHTKLFDRSVKFMKKHLRTVDIKLNDMEFNEIYSNASILLKYGLRRRFVPRLIGVKLAKLSPGAI
jgi:hypothetical protein